MPSRAGHYDQGLQSPTGLSSFHQSEAESRSRFIMGGSGGFNNTAGSHFYSSAYTSPRDFGGGRAGHYHHPSQELSAQFQEKLAEVQMPAPQQQIRKLPPKAV